MKLTAPQTSGLAYFAALRITDKAERKAARATMRHPDPRVIAALVAGGLLEQIGFSYGPLWGLSSAGVTAAAQLGLKGA